MAGNYNLTANINVRNNISPQTQQIARDLGSVRSQVATLSNQYRATGQTASSAMRQAWQEVNRTSQAERTATSETRNLQNSFSGFGGILSKIKGLAVGFAGTAFVKSLIGNASDMESARAKLETFTSSAQEAGEQIAYAKEFANKTPFETGDIVNGMIKMKAYSIETSDEMMTRFGNMAGAMGKSYDQVVEAIADAQTGEVERLKEFGITKQMIIDQGAKTMADKELVNSKGQIVDQENFNKALFQIMDERFKGGMEKQANTTKGLVSTFKGMKDNILSMLGGIDSEGNLIAGGLLSNVKNMVKGINDKMTELINNGTVQMWVDNFNNAIGWISNKVEYFKNLIIENKNIVIPIISGIATAFLAFKTITILSKAKTYFTALKTSLAVLVSPIGLVAIGIGVLVAGFIYAYKHSETFRNTVNNALNSVKDKAISLKDKIGGCIEAVKTWIEEHKAQIASVKAFVLAIWDTIIQYAQNTINNICTIFEGVIDVISGIIDIIAGIFQGDWNKVWEGFKEVVKGAIGIVKGWWQEIVDLFKTPINFVVNLFKRDQSEKAKVENTEETEEVGHNAKGTNNWRGGLTWVNEGQKGELMNLPNGTQIIPHDLSEQMVKEKAKSEADTSTNGQPIINIKIDKMQVREEADVSRLATEMINKIKIASLKFA